MFKKPTDVDPELETAKTHADRFLVVLKENGVADWDRALAQHWDALIGEMAPILQANTMLLIYNNMISRLYQSVTTPEKLGEVSVTINRLLNNIIRKLKKTTPPGEQDNSYLNIVSSFAILKQICQAFLYFDEAHPQLNLVVSYGYLRALTEANIAQHTNLTFAGKTYTLPWAYVQHAQANDTSNSDVDLHVAHLNPEGLLNSLSLHPTYSIAMCVMRACNRLIDRGKFPKVVLNGLLKNRIIASLQQGMADMEIYAADEKPADYSAEEGKKDIEHAYQLINDILAPLSELCDKLVELEGYDNRPCEFAEKLQTELNEFYQNYAMQHQMLMGLPEATRLTMALKAYPKSKSAAPNYTKALFDIVGTMKKRDLQKWHQIIETIIGGYPHMLGSVLAYSLNYGGCHLPADMLRTLVKHIKSFIADAKPESNTLDLSTLQNQLGQNRECGTIENNKLQAYLSILHTISAAPHLINKDVGDTIYGLSKDQLDKLKRSTNAYEFVELIEHCRINKDDPNTLIFSVDYIKLLEEEVSLDDWPYEFVINDMRYCLIDNDALEADKPIPCHVYYYGSDAPETNVVANWQMYRKQSLTAGEISTQLDTLSAQAKKDEKVDYHEPFIVIRERLLSGKVKLEKVEETLKRLKNETKSKKIKGEAIVSFRKALHALLGMLDEMNRLKHTAATTFDQIDNAILHITITRKKAQALDTLKNFASYFGRSNEIAHIKKINHNITLRTALKWCHQHAESHPIGVNKCIEAFAASLRRGDNKFNRVMISVLKEIQVECQGELNHTVFTPLLDSAGAEAVVYNQEKIHFDDLEKIIDAPDNEESTQELGLWVRSTKSSVAFLQLLASIKENCRTPTTVTYATALLEVINDLLSKPSLQALSSIGFFVRDKRQHYLQQTKEQLSAMAIVLSSPQR